MAARVCVCVKKADSYAFGRSVVAGILESFTKAVALTHAHIRVARTPHASCLRTPPHPIRTASCQVASIMGGKTKAAAITKKAAAQRKRDRAEAKKVKQAARLERERVEREARSPAEQALWLQNEGNPRVSRYSVCACTRARSSASNLTNRCATPGPTD